MESAMGVRGRGIGGNIGFRLSGDSRSEEIKMGAVYISDGASRLILCSRII
jgi:hypothetical protein